MPTLKAAAFFTLSRVPVLKPVPSLPLALPAEGMVFPGKLGGTGFPASTLAASLGKLACWTAES